MLMAKRSLLEELATLEKPDDFDIEDDERRDAFDSDDGSDNEADVANDHYVLVGKSKLRNNAPVLGGKYGGEKGSRKDFEQEEFSEPEMDDEEVTPDEELGSESDSGASLRANSDSEDDDEAGSDDDDDDDVMNRDSEDLQYKRKQLLGLMAQERKHIVNKLSENAMNDALKGYAIQSQHLVFDKIIDGRLKLQKAIQLANQLPFDQEVAQHEKLVTKKTSKYLDQACELCFNILDTVFALRNQLTEADKSGEPVALPKKRTYEDYNNTAKEMDDTLNQYRADVLTKWSAKVQNSQGLLAINQAKFKLINQSYEQQVQNNLGDMGRLMKRTRTNRRHTTPLGLDYYMKTRGGDDEVEEEDEEEDNPDIPKQVKQRDQSEIAGIFDDEDFYRVLLNDLVDKKLQSQNPTLGLTIVRTAQKAQKLNKNVDRAAQKDRKLRYNIHEKIANFEAPVNGLKWDDQQIDEFFAGLLGQKVNMNEDEAKDGDDAEAEEVEMKPSDDSIKLFG